MNKKTNTFNKFGVGNFRVLDEYYEFDIRPITILTGTNSSGKSSLIKALLSFSKSFTTSLEFDWDTINYKQLKLGDFASVKNVSKKEQPVTIKIPLGNLEGAFSINEFSLLFEFNNKNQNINIGALSSFKLLKGIEEKVVIEYHLSPYEFTEIKFLLSEIIENSKNLNYFRKLPALITDESKLKSHILDDLKLSIDDFIKAKNFIDKIKTMLNEECLSEINEREIANSKVADSDFHLMLSTDYELVMNTTIRDYLIKQELKMITDLCQAQGEDGYTNFMETLSMGPNAIRYQNINSSTIQTYLASPELFMEQNKNSILSFNTLHTYGDYILSFFESEFEKALSRLKIGLNEIKYLPVNRTTFERLIDLSDNTNYYINSLKAFANSYEESIAKKLLNKWVGKDWFDIADSVEIKSIANGAFAEIIFIKDGKERNILDLGYGYSQLFPILLSLSVEIYNKIQQIGPSDHNTDSEVHPLFMRPESIVIIEEPEANLHPALQSKLAEVFAECYKEYNFTFIIETHSEYLVRKLQYLIAKNDLQADDAVIYYFQKEGGKPYPISINERGSLSRPFDKGFFDEADKIALELFLLKKHQSN